MKKTIFFILTYTFITLPAIADDSKIISLQTSPAIGMIAVEYKLSDNLSISANAAAVNIALESSSNFLPFSYTSSTTYLSTKYSVGSRLSWYPKGVFNKGVYFSGFVDSIAFNYEKGAYNISADTISKGDGKTQALGFTFGYHWLWADYISLHAGAGTAYIRGTSLDTVTTTTTYNSTLNTSTSSSAASTSTLNGQVAFTLDLHLGFVF